MTRPLRIAFVVTELMVGGAENMLWKVLSRIDRSRYVPKIFALSGRADDILQRFLAIDVPCELIGMRPRLGDALRLLRLARALRNFEADIVQGWMYHGNLAASLAAPLARIGAPVLWNVRGTLPTPHEKKWRSGLVIGATRFLASKPARIVNNSVVSAIEHESVLRYPRVARVLIPNGFDTALFRPSHTARRALRDELGLPQDTLVVGLVSREHPMKDHGTFLRAAALLRDIKPDVHYVIVGEKLDVRNARLTSMVAALRLENRVHLLGRRLDMHRVTAGFDIACSASAYGEGFANVIGEAMSCGVACVVTDVGDAPHIVASTGAVVSPADPRALAEALRRFVEESADARRARGLAARQRIVEHYSLEVIVRQYEELYTRVAAETAAATLAVSSAATTEER